MIDKFCAEHFANDWIDSWNSHNLERILAHYKDDFEMSSPFIQKIADEPSGTLRGKTAIDAYWGKALQFMTDLHFQLISTLVGVDSITLEYIGAQGHFVAEFFFFSVNQKVVKAFCNTCCISL